MYRDDAFGRPNRDGHRDAFTELGGTVVGEAGFVPATVTKDEFKALLQAVTADDPSIILGTNNTGPLRLLLEAYVELRDDPTWTTKPPSFGALRFV